MCPTEWPCCARGVHRRCADQGCQPAVPHRYDGGPQRHPEYQPSRPRECYPRLEIKGLTVYDELGVKRLDNVTFTVNAGEVLGIAGIAGSGQRELLESIAGLYPIKLRLRPFP